MDGYTLLGSFLLLFILFIYLTWFGFSVKVENEKEDESEIKINPYDKLPLHRKIIDKKNNKIKIIDLGNHILIIGFILAVIFVSLNVD
jgi:Ca2+/Na+ antiporter